jgi:hypothetical protein
MNDLQLISLIDQALETGFTAQNLLVSSQQDYQPTTQGMNSGPTVYYHVLATERHGFATTTDALNNAIPPVMIRTTSQLLITGFQFNAKSIVDPTTATSQTLTANDLTRIAAGILNNEDTKNFLQSNGVQVIRIQNSRITYWKDEKGRFEGDPSFDCFFVHQDITTAAIGSTKIFAPGLYPV